jgi:hypothetical protein
VPDDGVAALLGIAKARRELTGPTRRAPCLLDPPVVPRYRPWQLGESAARDIRLGGLMSVGVVRVTHPDGWFGAAFPARLMLEMRPRTRPESGR